jgi:UDP-N-acetylglucosamine transferase subunit ALG13
VIFVTVGTAHFPFDRLVRAAATLPVDEIVLQHGPVEVPPGVACAVPFMSLPETLDHFRLADVVVMHGGVGSVLCAQRFGHTPVVVPRRRRHGETVDDHQVEFVRALADQDCVIPVWNIVDLAEAVRSVPPRLPSVEETLKPIHRAVAQALGDDPSNPPLRVSVRSSV